MSTPRFSRGERRAARSARPRRRGRARRRCRQAACRAQAPGRRGGCATRSPVAVRIRSPAPVRPMIVSARPPSATPSRAISARPRVISAARAFWPRPSPSQMPTAIASTFLTAPPISTPDDVVAVIDAQRAAVQLRREPCAQAPRRPRRASARTAVPAPLRARRRPRTARRTGARPSSAATIWCGSPPRVLLEALAQPDERRRRCGRGEALRYIAQAGHRSCDDQQLGAARGRVRDPA